MRHHAIRKIGTAKQLIEDAMNDCLQSRQACDFAAREMGITVALPEGDPRSALQSRLGDRSQVGLQICLAAAAATLDASMTLLGDSAKQTSDDRERILQSCAALVKDASEVVLQASSVLAGNLAQSNPQRV